MIHIFLPAYNEEEALPKLLSKIDAALNSQFSYQVIILDDGSRDRTSAVAEQLSSQYPIRLIRHPKNLGLGQTLIDGFEYLAAHTQSDDLVITLDCDDTHEPRYVLPALQKARSGYDVVILSRYVPGGKEEGLSFKRRILSRGASLFLKTFFPIPGVKDYSCGFRVFRASIIKKAIDRFGRDFIRLPHLGFVGAAEILIKFKMIDAKMTEVPFTLRYDQKPGVSKNRPFRTISGYFALVWLYRVCKPFGRHIPGA